MYVMQCNAVQCNAMQCNVLLCCVVLSYGMVWYVCMYIYIYMVKHQRSRRRAPGDWIPDPGRGLGMASK